MDGPYHRKKHPSNNHTNLIRPSVITQIPSIRVHGLSVGWILISVPLMWSVAHQMNGGNRVRSCQLYWEPLSESRIRTGARSAQKAMHEVQTQISQAALSEASMHCFASSPAAEEPSAAGYAGQRTGAETTSPLPCLLPSNLPLPGSYLWPWSARLSHLSSIGTALILSAVQVLCKSSPTRSRRQLRMRRRQSASGGGIACTFVPPSISDNRWMRRMKPRKY